MGMKIGNDGVVRITVTVEQEDVDLLDRLARLEDSNRSAELRNMLASVRPLLKATVDALESAKRTKESFLNQAAEVALADLQVVLPEVERINNTILGAMSRLEGASASLPPSSNTGVTFNTPPFFEDPQSGPKESS